MRFFASLIVLSMCVYSDSLKKKKSPWACLIRSLLNILVYSCSNIFLPSPKDMLINLRERGRKGEKHTCERETLIGCLTHTHPNWAEPAAWACALTGNQTLNLQPHHVGLSVLNDLSVE